MSAVAAVDYDVLPPARMPSGTLGRRCACGGHVIGGGECARCRARRLERERHGTTVADVRPVEQPARQPRGSGDLSGVATESAPDGLTEMARLLRRRSTGAPLAEPARARVESRVGRPLGSVRVHDDGAAGAAARLIGTRAFTIGRDVYLGAEAPRSCPAADRVLDHELAHTLQQRDWTGGSLAFDRGAGRHEPEAERVASGVGAVQGDPGPPSVMALHPAVWALIAGELACLFGFYLYGLTKLGHKGDKYLHCWTSCKIATWCPPVPLASQAIAGLVGALKELADIVIGEAELRDMKNNISGIECSVHYLTSCDDCCQAKLTAGTLAAAPTGPGERESELTATEAAALARDEAGAAPTAAPERPA